MRHPLGRTACTASGIGRLGALRPDELGYPDADLPSSDSPIRRPDCVQYSIPRIIQGPSPRNGRPVCRLVRDLHRRKALLCRARGIRRGRVDDRIPPQPRDLLRAGPASWGLRRCHAIRWHAAHPFPRRAQAARRCGNALGRLAWLARRNSRMRLPNGTSLGNRMTYPKHHVPPGFCAA